MWEHEEEEAGREVEWLEKMCSDFYISVPTMNNNNNKSSAQAVVNYVKQYAKRT